MGCVLVYTQKIELRYWWEYVDEKSRISFFRLGMVRLAWSAWHGPLGMVRYSENS